uniref:Chitin-binding type-2 domain-containing protein n=1 Tax=Syphacia muris TaxID=451379 RepID=A0A0N5AT92_9BILA
MYSMTIIAYFYAIFWPVELRPTNGLKTVLLVDTRPPSIDSINTSPSYQCKSLPLDYRKRCSPDEVIASGDCSRIFYQCSRKGVFTKRLCKQGFVFERYGRRCIKVTATHLSKCLSKPEIQPKTRKFIVKPTIAPVITPVPYFIISYYDALTVPISAALPNPSVSIFNSNEPVPKIYDQFDAPFLPEYQQYNPFSYSSSPNAFKGRIADPFHLNTPVQLFYKTQPLQPPVGAAPRQNHNLELPLFPNIANYGKKAGDYKEYSGFDQTTEVQKTYGKKSDIAANEAFQNYHNVEPTLMTPEKAVEAFKQAAQSTDRNAKDKELESISRQKPEIPNGVSNGNAAKDDQIINGKAGEPEPEKSENMNYQISEGQGKIDMNGDSVTKQQKYSTGEEDSQSLGQARVDGGASFFIVARRRNEQYHLENQKEGGVRSVGTKGTEGAKIQELSRNDALLRPNPDKKASTVTVIGITDNIGQQKNKVKGQHSNEQIYTEKNVQRTGDERFNVSEEVARTQMATSNKLDQVHSSSPNDEASKNSNDEYIHTANGSTKKSSQTYKRRQGSQVDQIPPQQQEDQFNHGVRETRFETELPKEKQQVAFAGDKNNDNQANGQPENEGRQEDQVSVEPPNEQDNEQGDSAVSRTKSAEAQDSNPSAISDHANEVVSVLKSDKAELNSEQNDGYANSFSITTAKPAQEGDEKLNYSLSFRKFVDSR